MKITDCNQVDRVTEDDDLSLLYWGPRGELFIHGCENKFIQVIKNPDCPDIVDESQPVLEVGYFSEYFADVSEHPYLCLNRKTKFKSTHKLYAKLYGGQMMKILSMDQNNIIQKILFENGIEKAYINGNDIDEEEKFRYDEEDNELTFTNWNRGEPNAWTSNEDCIEIHSSTGKWFDSPCGPPRLAGLYNVPDDSIEHDGTNGYITCYNMEIQSWHLDSDNTIKNKECPNTEIGIEDWKVSSMITTYLSLRF